ncbi:pyruvate kinase [Clostridium estertheticum]|uniref:Pyruvate kinase n=1 Tax=Clostridium estertheticum TaxID=238834 RepID=A0A7Y3SV91_9CLOT|nr:pyruvate kinase [Clostridium estertheticum]NNU75951.1 pyruvate kinase [Clostridium estertheticum]WBL46626.1 pyruvate kinase [Clostridium estertheticum]
MQKTKMIFTIGPASDSKEILTKLMEIGMKVTRLNFSHGTHEDHKIKIDIIKSLREELNKSVAIMLDIKGPKIRTHKFIGDTVAIDKGQRFIFSCGKEILGNKERCSVSYAELYKDLKANGRLLVDDGLIEFKIDSIEGTEINCTALNSGLIGNHKGINVPNISIGLPAVTDKDKLDLIFGCEQGVDIVAASFIRKAGDVTDVRNILNANGGEHIQIISKIETQEGVDNIDAIIEASDGIMVARGDMGVEIPIQKVPIVQKMIIHKCNKAGKPVITATQMLDSMIRNPRPTRAEASDIANAIFDGTDAIMLSGESANGKYPLESALTMANIAIEAESNIDFRAALNKRNHEVLENISDGISLATCNTADKLNVSAIITATQSGHTARIVSKYRPMCPIIAVTPSKQVARGLSINFGVQTILSIKLTSTDELMADAVKKSLASGYIKKGDVVIIAAGIPVGESGTTNMMKIQKV